MVGGALAAPVGMGSAKLSGWLVSPRVARPRQSGQVPVWPAWARHCGLVCGPPAVAGAFLDEVEAPDGAGGPRVAVGEKASKVPNGAAGPWEAAFGADGPGGPAGPPAVAGAFLDDVEAPDGAAGPRLAADEEASKAPNGAAGPGEAADEEGGPGWAAGPPVVVGVVLGATQAPGGAAGPRVAVDEEAAEAPNGAAGPRGPLARP